MYIFIVLGVVVGLVVIFIIYKFVTRKRNNNSKYESFDAWKKYYGAYTP